MRSPASISTIPLIAETPCPGKTKTSKETSARPAENRGHFPPLGVTGEQRDADQQAQGDGGGGLGGAVPGALMDT